MKQEIDIFLIQEHWLFHCELNMLSEIHTEIAGSGKAVDSDDPTSASYMAIGYGGKKTLQGKYSEQKSGTKNLEENITRGTPLIHSNSGDKHLFYKLVRKQRQNGNTFIMTQMSTERFLKEISYLDGILILAIYQFTFNYQHLQLCEMDYNAILEMYIERKACVKWTNDTSGKFPVQQGVKQGGILTADLSKIYIEDLLHNIEHIAQVCTIGETSVNAIACVDEVALMKENPAELQFLLNIATEFSQKKASEKRYSTNKTKQP
ncbi:unnamed protein product [Mytilus coruscus]|uniref:Uncharacterized protein n=1 Tax=Mytilus coruscus TaxID=42192 RepID=A0A6J8E742_MYTCO|nr:unnamed protein product [Mytilus coruscus]